MSDSNRNPQPDRLNSADKQHVSADSRPSDAVAANDDVQIDASTEDALRFWLRLVALS